MSRGCAGEGLHLTGNENQPEEWVTRRPTPASHPRGMRPCDGPRGPAVALRAEGKRCDRAAAVSCLLDMPQPGTEPQPRNMPRAGMEPPRAWDDAPNTELAARAGFLF